jgi:serine/threonine-protein kinase
MLKFETLGPYRIGKRIGVGGMGEVYEAVHVETGQPAAIKLLSPALASTEDFRDRFAAEIDSLRILNHAHIVKLFGFGEQEGLLYYAMEYVQGRTLESEIIAGRRFTWREVTTLGIQICKALKHAHDHGVIHRDLKPANLLLTADDNIKLLDFGIARLFGASNLTSVGGVLGTADYMSPEQADGRPVNDRCDQYALGGVLYALLAGRPPFRARSLPELLQLQRFADPEPVRRYCADAPEELERIIGQLLAKDPEARFPNTLVVARRLEAMLRALSRPLKEDEFQLAKHSTGEPLAEMPLEETIEATRVYEQKPAAAALAHTAATAEAAEDELELEVQTPNPAETHFTSMAELARRERQSERRSIPLMLLQASGAVATILLLVGVLWWMLRPASADTLYRRIQLATEDEMRNAEPDVTAFLERYPDDPRAEEVAAYQEEMRLQQTQRRLKARSKLIGSRGGMLPIERMYVSAITHTDSNPERAISELSALVDMYEGDLSLSVEQQRCLKLARKQIKRLEEEIYGYAPDDLTALEERLARANEVQETDPERARRIWQAIVRLAGNRPWAAKVVAEAQASLAEAGEAKEPGEALSAADE